MNKENCALLFYSRIIIFIFTNNININYQQLVNNFILIMNMAGYTQSRTYHVKIMVVF